METELPHLKNVKLCEADIIYSLFFFDAGVMILLLFFKKFVS